MLQARKGLLKSCLRSSDYLSLDTNRKIAFTGLIDHRAMVRPTDIKFIKRVGFLLCLQSFGRDTEEGRGEPKQRYPMRKI